MTEFGHFHIIYLLEIVEYDLAFYDKKTMFLRTAPPQPIMSWSIHLARQNLAKTLVSIAFAVFASVLGYVAISPYAAVIVGAAALISLSDFLLPVRFEIWQDRAVCRMLLKSAEIKWADVRRCYLDDYGVKLSPLDRASRLEAFRGVYLRFAGNESEVIEAVRELRPSVDE